jgi:hypothetical protein
MALLRISNLAPTSAVAYDPFREIKRGDVIFTHQGLLINLRWTKTLQKYRQTAQIHLFSIPNSIACPVAAFKKLSKNYPVAASDPLLSYCSASKVIIITQGDIRRALKKSVLSLGLNHKLTFHSIQRSSASLAFASGVPFQAIQAHGTWASDALWAYIDPSARDASVPRCFSSVFSGLGK